MDAKKYQHKSLYYAFYPSRIAIAAVKAVSLGFALEVLDDMDHFDMENTYDWSCGMTDRETQQAIVSNVKRLLVRDICISTVERAVEHAIVARTEEHFNHKLFKSGFSYWLISIHFIYNLWYSFMQVDG